MNIKCVKTDLIENIQIVQKAISSRGILPILSSIFFQTQKNNLTLSATDLEMSIKCNMKAKVISQGIMVVPAKLIGDIIRNLPESTIEIKVDSQKRQVKIICENSEFNINIFPEDDFPKTPDQTKEVFCIVNGGEFLNGIKKVIRATSKDESRPVLTGVLLNTTKDKLKMVATDSYRLAVCEIPVKKIEQEIEVIIPARVLNELIKILKEDQEVKISLAANQINFNFSEVNLTSRLIEGQYPNYQQLLPERYEIKANINKENFIDAVKRVSLLTQHNVPLNIDLNPSTANIYATTQEVGEANEKLLIDYQGKELKIALNPQYLLDGLSCVEGNNVVIKLIDALKPGLIKSAETEKFLYLIMPVRTN